MSLATKLAKANAKGVKSMLGTDSKFLTESTEFLTTPLPVYNIANSGRIDGGLSQGVTILAGDSGTGKTLLSWVGAKSFLDAHDDGVVLFYDSEYGTTNEYLKGLGIDVDRVIHTPVNNIEELRFDIIAKLDEITENDNVYIIVDSLGNIASKKEVDDARNENSAQDMTRAKSMKGLFRQITPLITSKGIYFVGIAHVYSGQGMFAETVVSGGTGLMYAANTILILTKAKDKDASAQTGIKINMRVKKSRYIRDDARFTAYLDFNKGFKPFSGLVDLLIDTGLVIKPSNGFYQIVNPETGELIENGKKFRLKEIESREYLVPLLKSDKFKNGIKEKFLLVKDTQGTLDSTIVNDLK